MRAMKMVMVAAMVAALYAPAAFGSTDPYHVPGESLDSGLGQLSADYTGAEFQRVLGESLDSGLGQLSADYTGAEFQRVMGESLDDGLGNLPSGYTAAEYQRKPMQSAAAGRQR